MFFDARATKLNLILLGSGIVFYWGLCLWLFVQSNTPVEPSDGVYHYQISRYSWQNPENLLNHWGKPLFNIFSSPFAQLGYIGMVVFNLLLFSLSALVLYKMGRHFSFAFAGLSPFLLMSSSVYFTMVNAGMTEILMAFLTLLGAYLFIKNRAGWGATIISLTIVARPEAVIVIPLYGLMLLLSRNWKYIPLLLSGLVIFSLWGYLGFDKNLLWVIKDDPYPFNSPYGMGPFSHFIDHHKEIFGLLLTVMGGFAVVLFLARQLQLLTSDKLAQLLFFLIGSSVLILVLHSFLWWKGLKGSLGLIRVMATVIPAVCFCALYAINKVYRPRLKLVSSAFIFALAGFSCVKAYSLSGLPARMDERSEILAEAAEWYKQHPAEGRVSYLSPFFAFKADLNPEDPEEVVLLWSIDKNDPSKSLSPGEVIVWDSQFGPLEGQMPEESISDNPNLKIEKYLQTDTTGLPEGALPFRVYIARVLPQPSKSAE